MVEILETLSITERIIGLCIILFGFLSYYLIKLNHIEGKINPNLVLILSWGLILIVIFWKSYTVPPPPIPNKIDYTHFITGGENFYKVALRNKYLDANNVQKLNHDKKFYDETYLATLNKGDSVILLAEYESCYSIKAICTNAKNNERGWQNGYIIKFFQGINVLKPL